MGSSNIPTRSDRKNAQVHTNKRITVSKLEKSNSALMCLCNQEFEGASLAHST